MKTAMFIVMGVDAFCAVLLIATVLLQSGKSAGLSGAIAGGSDSYLSKGGSRSLDAKLAKATKWIGLAFALLTLVSAILARAVYGG